MKALYEIRHGSKESIDEDVYLVCDRIPSKEEYIEFKKTQTKDYNIITIQDGHVTDCLKGLKDEINNSIFYTFYNHPQIVQNPILSLVERDIFPKVVMVVREMLAFASRTKYRDSIKMSLKSGIFSDRVQTLISINLTEIESFDKISNQEALKFYAQQLGMIMPLLEGKKEIFDKELMDEDLKPFLYRKEITEDDLCLLNDMLRRFTLMLTHYFAASVSSEEMNIVTLKDGRKFDVKFEKYI